MGHFERITVTLTIEERNARAREAALIFHELTLARENAKEAAKEAKERIGEIELRHQQAVTSARTGAEERDVEVEQQPDVDRLVVHIVAVETGEVVRDRPMSEDEIRAAKQARLPFRDAAPAPVVQIREGTTGGAVEGIRQTTGGISPLRGNTRRGQPPTP